MKYIKDISESNFNFFEDMSEKILIEFNPKNGITIPDALIEEWVSENIIDGKIYTIGSERIIDYIRIAILEEKIDKNKVRIIFNNRIYNIDEFGIIDPNLNNPWDMNKYLRKIVKLQMEKRLK